MKNQQHKDSAELVRRVGSLLEEEHVAQGEPVCQPGQEARSPAQDDPPIWQPGVPHHWVEHEWVKLPPEPKPHVRAQGQTFLPGMKPRPPQP